jgi:hypothetical protein
MIYKFVHIHATPLGKNIFDFPRKLESAASFFKLSAVIGQYAPACVAGTAALYFYSELEKGSERYGSYEITVEI